VLAPTGTISFLMCIRPGSEQDIALVSTNYWPVSGMLKNRLIKQSTAAEHLSRLRPKIIAHIHRAVDLFDTIEYATPGAITRAATLAVRSEAGPFIQRLTSRTISPFLLAPFARTSVNAIFITGPCDDGGVAASLMAHLENVKLSQENATGYEHNGTLRVKMSARVEVVIAIYRKNL